MKKIGIVLVLVTLLALGAQISCGAPLKQGELTVIEPDGKLGGRCPLERTSVRAEVSGFVARVEVKQIFHNPCQEKIEAVYTFPLSSNGAVDGMLMKVGERTIRGIVKPREEAKRIYEDSRDRGKVASLLDQDRPNIFTQSVANIMPGDKVEIIIRYVETLTYEDGHFQFVFPMVVGPRFLPGRPNGRKGTGWSDDTTSVPDASRMTPPVAEEGTRAGHDIDLTVTLDAGVPIEKVESLLHEVKIQRKSTSEVEVSLKNSNEIPNRDFVLRYHVASEEVRSGVITHREGKSGYVTVVMIPPKQVRPEQIAPRELIFIIDTSGSQAGLPLEKAKETVQYILDRMNPQDTFNVIDFNNTARVLFSSPKQNNPETREKALRYIQSLKGSGGTQMVPAIWEALSTPPSENRLRIVSFMTDGLIGNDFEVISMVKKLRGTSRWFCFGTGNSVNRFLLDHVARVGGGDVDYILLKSSGEEIAKKFYEQIAAPVLTDISFSCQGIELEEVYPAAVSDLWAHKPLILKARYAKPGRGEITIQGIRAGKPYKQPLKVVLPEKESSNSSLGALWARAKVDDLTDKDLMGIQRGNPNPGVKEQIIKAALENGIVTQFTSFVAVEETVVTVDGKPTKVTVPVELPEGVSREGVFGTNQKVLMQGSPRPPASGTAANRRLRLAFKQKGSEGGRAVPKNAQTASAKPIQKVFSREKTARQCPSSLKLSPDLMELLEMQERPRNYVKDGVVVRNGQILIQVWLLKSGDEVVKRLEEKGLKVTFRAATGKLVLGTILLEHLDDLAMLSEVRLVQPFVPNT